MAASGDAAAAEPLQYTTTVLRVSIHCEGCKKKVKKVLHGIEGVYKVTIDAVQHKVTVTGSVGADALVRRLHKSGKQASLWPVPPPAAEAKKPEEVAVAPSAGKSGKGADKAAEAAVEAESEKKPEKEKAGSEKKSEKEKSGSEKKPETAETKKPKDEAKESEVPEKGSPEPAKEAAAEEATGEETGGKKGKKKKNKQKDAGEGDAAAEKKPPPPHPHPHPQPKHAMPVPAPSLGPPDRPHDGFPYYAPPPVMSYNVAHPSASVSCYAPTPVVSMQPMPPQMPYGYSPYPPMMAPPPEFLYGPPGMRSSPPQESYNNMFNEENPNSCSLM